MRRLLALVLRLWPLACAAAPLAAHPIHTSYAEADFRGDRDAGRLQIALRLFTDDAEAALTRRTGAKVTLTAAPSAAIDAQLLAYARATFIVKSPAGVPQPLAWVGRELKDRDQHLWLYFECPLPGGPYRARIASRVLRDVFTDQVNSVRVRDPGPPARQVTLLFITDREQAVAFGS